MSKMKTAFEWVDGGIPMLSGKAADRERYVRWVAMIQEDAVKCYETTAAIEEVEQAFERVAKDIEPNDDLAHLEGMLEAFGVLRMKMANLAKLKVPSEE